MTAAPAPFTSEDYAGRMQRAVTDAADAGLAGVLVMPGPDLTWLTGYQVTAVTERLTVLVLRPDAEPTLLTPALERPDAEGARARPALTITDWADADRPVRRGERSAARQRHVRHLGLRLGDAPAGPAARAAADRLPRRCPTRCRCCARSRTRTSWPGWRRRGPRPTRRSDEIVHVRFAGRRELDVAADLAALLRQHGHEQVDFTVVGSGPNGANPHHEAGDRVIQDGDAVVLDFGGLMYGYGSDTTRTVAVGEVSDEVREVHEIVRRAQQAGVDAVRPGVTCQDIDRAARAVITDAGYGEQFIHRTGHGIGVTTHEPPYMVEGEEQQLRPGMCFSVEPGIYLAGRFGVRIEDIVTVTEDGVRSFNTTDHALATVE